MIKEVAARYAAQIELKIYRVGRDVAYLRKYGNITRGTMIIGGRIKTERLDRGNVELLIKRALEEYADV